MGNIADAMLLEEGERIMTPEVGRMLFASSACLLMMSLICIPYLEANSAEFVVDIMAVGLNTGFLIYLARRLRAGNGKERSRTSAYGLLKNWRGVKNRGNLFS